MSFFFLFVFFKLNTALNFTRDIGAIAAAVFHFFVLFLFAASVHLLGPYFILFYFLSFMIVSIC